MCELETSRMGAPYIYDISSLRFNDLTFILLTWRKWLAPNNASRQQMGINFGFKVLKRESIRLHEELLLHLYLSCSIISWSIARGWSVELLVRMGKMRNASVYLVGKPE